MVYKKQQQALTPPSLPGWQLRSLEETKTSKLSNLLTIAPNPCAGFTMVEALVTLTVMSLLFAMVGSILTSLLNSEKKINEILDRERVGTAILEVIARDLQGLYVYEIDGALLGSDEFVSGHDGDRLEFVSNRTATAQHEEEASSEVEELEEGAEQLPPPFRLAKIGYFLKESQSAPSLLTLFRYDEVYEPPAAGDDTGSTENAANIFEEEGEEREVFEIYDRVRSFNVRFLDEEDAWQESWQESAIMPLAIEVTLEIEPGTGLTNTGYEDAFEEKRRGVYRTLLWVPIELPPLEEEEQ